MQRPTMSSKFRERLAREAEIGNAIDGHDDIATRIAEKIAETIAETINDAPMGAPVFRAMNSLLFATRNRKEHIQTFVEQLTPLISTELEPLMKVLMEAVKGSYVIDVDSHGQVLRCEVCKVRTSFEAGHPFSSKLMRHKSDCWVDQAQKLIRRADDESAS